MPNDKTILAKNLVSVNSLIKVWIKFLLIYFQKVEGRVTSVLGSFDPFSPRLREATNLRTGQASCEV
jgi:hypothetical protein